MVEGITVSQLMDATRESKSFSPSGDYNYYLPMQEHQKQSAFHFAISFIDYINNPSEENGKKAMSNFEAVVRSGSDPRMAIDLVLIAFPNLRKSA